MSLIDAAKEVYDARLAEAKLLATNANEWQKYVNLLKHRADAAHKYACSRHKLDVSREDLRLLRLSIATAPPTKIRTLIARHRLVRTAFLDARNESKLALSEYSSSINAVKKSTHRTVTRKTPYSEVIIQSSSKYNKIYAETKSERKLYRGCSLSAVVAWWINETDEDEINDADTDDAVSDEDDVDDCSDIVKQISCIADGDESITDDELNLDE